MLSPLFILAVSFSEPSYQKAQIKVTVRYRFSQFEIDPGLQEVRRAGESVRIEPQVFDLIVHLVRNRDRIVSKDELIEEIWNGRVISEAAFSSRINGARRALGDTGNDQIFIKTLHKRGFRFVGDVQEITNQDIPLAPVAASTSSVPAEVSASAEVGGLGDVVSESIRADAAMRTSIAVMPFENISGDPENDYFSYGLVEDIIRLLARNRWLSVISRHSTVAFKNRQIDPRDAGQQLSVKYLVLGSVRRSRDAVRIATDLVRTCDGEQLWSETYDLQLASIFEIQEEMATQISATIEPELSKVEQKLATRKAPSSLDAWDCYQRGLWNLWQFTTPAFDQAEAYFQRAIEADRNFARAYGALAYVNVQRAFLDNPSDRLPRLTKALHQARASVVLDDLDCFCQCVLGRALCLTHKNDEALAALDLALELNPSFAQAYFAQGFNLLWHGREMEAEVLLDRATILSPRDSDLWSFHHVRSLTHFSLGEYDIATEFARRAVRQRNVNYQAFATLAASLGLLGETAQAREAAAGLLQSKPGYSTDTAKQQLFFCKDPRFLDRYIRGLQEAGVTSG